MQVKQFIIIIALFGVCANVQAQHQTIVNDSIWCVHLNEFIKCSSLDVITPLVGKERLDSADVAVFTPKIHLLPATNEQVERQYNKVTYTSYLYSSPVNNTVLSIQFEKWYKKLKGCLVPWGLGRFDNPDPALKAYQDYFFTNSEDETSVRLDVIKEGGAYHVRLRIY